MHARKKEQAEEEIWIMDNQGDAKNGPNPHDALGFSAAPKDDKYNTVFLVSNLQKERKKNTMIAIGVVLALLVVGSLFVILRPESQQAEMSHEAQAPTAAPEAQPTPTAPATP